MDVGALLLAFDCILIRQLCASLDVHNLTQLQLESAVKCLVAIIFTTHGRPVQWPELIDAVLIDHLLSLNGLKGLSVLLRKSGDAEYVLDIPELLFVHKQAIL